MIWELLRRARKPLDLFVGALVVGVTAASCVSASTSATQSAPPKPDSIVVVVGTDIIGQSIEPAANMSGAAIGLLYSVYDGLYKFDKAGNPVRSLATSDVVSSDGLTETISIRNNVLFHDGSPMTADDVKYSLDRARGSDPALPNATAASYLAAVSSVDVTDATTVVLRLKRPEPLMQRALAYLAGMIVPKAYLTRVGNDGFWKSPIGSGPYRVVEKVAGDHIGLASFANYWGDKASIKNVTYKIIPDPASRIAALQSGGADFVIDTDPSQVDPLRKAGLAVVANPQGENLFLQLNRFSPGAPTDSRVGQALNMAVDRDSIIKNIMLGFGSPIASLETAPGMIDPALKPYPFDPAKAKQLLMDAGFDFNTALHVANPIGRYLKSDEIAQAVSSDLAKIGVKLQVDNMEYGAWVQHFLDHNFGTMTFSTIPNTTFDPLLYMRISLLCKGAYSTWCDPALDALVDQVSALTGEARVQGIQKIDRLIHDNPPGIMLLGYSQINAMKSNVVWNATPGTRVVKLTDLSYK